ncbi:MAG: endonuclease/exonuclease/phosphatase family protein, partial [Pseudonocardiaceae bacterium]
VCAGALALGVSALAPGSVAAAEPYSVLQINICNSGHNTDCYSGEATTRAGDLINARKPSVVTVNEMCASDLGPIRERTGYHGVFTQSGSRTCTNGRLAYGNAVLFPAGTSVGTPYPPLTYDDQNSNVELRTLRCVPAAGVTTCVTHLTNDSGFASKQAREMKDVVGDYARQGPTVLGGDWNITYPNAQDYVPAGMFRKGDGDVQHVMATSAHFGFTRTRVMNLDWTDHPALQVYLTR